MGLILDLTSSVEDSSLSDELRGTESTAANADQRQGETGSDSSTSQPSQNGLKCESEDLREQIAHLFCQPIHQSISPSVHTIGYEMNLTDETVSMEE